MHDRYNKLASSIVTSSIWVAPAPVFKVFMGFLAMKDSSGFVGGSIPGMANLCGMPISEFEEALAVLMNPDPYSRTPDDEGRRLRAVDGGWQVINNDKYEMALDREVRREQNRRAQQRFREKRRGASNQERNNNKHDVSENQQDKHPQPQPQPQKKEIKKESAPKNDAIRIEAEAILQKINEMTGRTFTANPNSLEPILGRLKEFTSADLLLVAEHLNALWKDDEHMRTFIRPMTIFRKSPFEERLALARDWEKRGKPSLSARSPRDQEMAARDAGRRINGDGDEGNAESGRLQSDGVIRTFIESGRWKPERPIPATVYDALAAEGFDLANYKREELKT